MGKQKKPPPLRQVLAAMESRLEELRNRLGSAEVDKWETLSRQEQNDALAIRWPDILWLWRRLRYVQARIGRLGRDTGDRTKVTPSMIRRIKLNGRHKITALAKELGISRQTIYTVLRETSG